MTRQFKNRATLNNKREIQQSEAKGDLVDGETSTREIRTQREEGGK